MFDEPCGIVTKEALREQGYFHFIEPAPVAPSRQLKIERKTKLNLMSGDFDTRVQSLSEPMLTAIAADTKTAMDLLPAGQQFLFFGTSVEQCDQQAAAYKEAGLAVEAYHNKLSSAEQERIMSLFRAGELIGLCTVSKVNRGFDLPSIALAVIGFGTASRSKFEQMCGRAQRIFSDKTAAWLLDYGAHGQRFGSANWDYPEALEFDRREKLRVPATELIEAIRTGRRDPKCEVRPDNFLDLVEAAVDLFDVIAKPFRSMKGTDGAILYYVHAPGYNEQYVWAGTGWTARVLRFLGASRFQQFFADPPGNSEELIADVLSAELPSHVLLRRVYDDYRKKIIIAPVGFRRDGQVYIFDSKPAVTEEWLRERAHCRIAYEEGVDA
jgi:hypothetical protein